MAVPYRFKAGGSTGPSASMSVGGTVHHHRSTTKIDHKPFKSRHASNRDLKDQAKGKVESNREDRGKRRTPYQQVMSKLARKNQAKQLRQNHKDKHDQESHIFHGPDGAPKHIAVVPLSPSIHVQTVISQLNDSVDAQATASTNGTSSVRVDRFRRNLLYLPAQFNLFNAIDICKLADWVIFVLTPDQQYDDDVDAILRAIEGQGMTSFAAIVQNMHTIPTAKHSRLSVDLKSNLGHYLPQLDKLSSLDSKSDCANLVRSLCTASTKGIRWRDDRSWMLVDQVRWNDSDSSTSNVSITGTIRGRPLNPDRLVHLPGWGEYKIAKIRQIIPQSHKRKADDMAVEEAGAEWGPSADQDDLAELAPEIVDMLYDTSINIPPDQKGVLLDDHHYFSDDDSHIPLAPKKLPTGTSSYQAAWLLDDVSDSDSDIEDEDGDIKMESSDVPRPEDGFVAKIEPTDAGPSEYPESEMHVDAEDDEEARQLQEFRSSRKNEADEDLEFPDEIELHPNADARERLAKYRGLKSLRTSEWNTAEDAPYEPQDFKRLLQIPDYKKSYSAAKKDSLIGAIQAGTKVKIELQAVPIVLKAGAAPSSMFSLLKHEHKHSVINLNMSLRSEIESPLRSKEELIVQIGHRRLIINPVFSASGQTPNDVHKFDRFLHPGRTAIATFTGPVTWGSVPVLVFKQQPEPEHEAPKLVDAMQGTQSGKSELKLIGSATTVPSSNSRVIAKRVILTGHPFKIHKKLVTVRYMFFKRDDVAWFAALPLWTKRGRQGFIKEPLGTHGYFKATFDGKINPMDAIGVSLYKRVWPRPARRYDS